MKIGGMGGLEIVIILVVVLLIFGPKNLPKLGNAFGKTISNLRSGMNEGKKKKEVEEQAQQNADASEPERPEPAQLEAVVEDEIAVPAAQDAASAQDVVVDALETLPDEPAAANEADAAAAVEETPEVNPGIPLAEPAESAGQPRKKVKRVVKKKA